MPNNQQIFITDSTNLSGQLWSQTFLQSPFNEFVKELGPIANDPTVKAALKNMSDADTSIGVGNTAQQKDAFIRATAATTALNIALLKFIPVSDDEDLPNKIVDFVTQRSANLAAYDNVAQLVTTPDDRTRLERAVKNASCMALPEEAQLRTCSCLTLC